ncbi:MAG: hypothetical protein RJB05_1141, partial [Armatimonadota bacterium]
MEAFVFTFDGYSFFAGSLSVIIVDHCVTELSRPLMMTLTGPAAGPEITALDAPAI